MSDWLQIWTAASSLDVKGTKAIKKKSVFLANRLVFPNTVTYCDLVTILADTVQMATTLLLKTHLVDRVSYRIFCWGGAGRCHVGMLGNITYDIATKKIADKFKVTDEQVTVYRKATCM